MTTAKAIKPKICKNTDCRCSYTPKAVPDSGYCSPRCYYACKPEKPRKAIPQKSAKRKADDKIYSPERIAFLALPENQICFIKGCGQRSTTIEHIMGRKGFADQWARDNKISLYIDQRHWRGCCFAHNGELENNPALSKEYQLSKIHGGSKI